MLRLSALLLLLPSAALAAPTLVLSTPDLAELRAQDRVASVVAGTPWRFGVAGATDLTTDTFGEWTQRGDGSRVWTARVESPGAFHLNVLFSELSLEPGATLTLTGRENTEVHGEHTGPLGSLLMRGDVLNIQLVESAQAAHTSVVHIDAIVHGYRDALSHPAYTVGDSGSCNVNAACSAADGWRDAVSSVAILNLGFGLCTATLVNNTAQDQRPYLLTAYHCYSGTNPGQWGVGFNYQSQGCDNPTSEPDTDWMQGASIVATYEPTDMALVELNDTIPDNFEVFFAGWDATGTTPPNTASIHHPAGDIKKFSFDATPPAYSNGYWSAVWDLGTTEGGSSGSGLFDDRGRVIGHLLGGSASCNNPNGPDNYGAVSADWDGGGTAASRLSDHLDPLGIDPGVWEGFGVGGLEYDAHIALASPIDGGTSCGETVSVNITNRGQQDLRRLKIEVTADGEVYKKTWRGRLAFNESELFYVNIDVERGGVSHQVSVVASDPNGKPDEATSNNSAAASFSVIEVQGDELPMSLDLDSGDVIVTRQDPQAGATWQPVDIEGRGTVAGMDNLTQDNIRHLDALVLGTFDLSKGRKPMLRFDVAYAQYGQEYADGLRVVVTNACDNVQTVVWESYGAELATADMTEEPFVPTERDWESIKVNLSDFEDQVVTLELVNVGAWGQWMYLDEIRVTHKRGLLGCGCSTTGTPALAWLTLPLIALVLRRRRLS